MLACFLVNFTSIFQSQLSYLALQQAMIDFLLPAPVSHPLLPAKAPLIVDTQFSDSIRKLWMYPVQWNTAAYIWKPPSPLPGIISSEQPLTIDKLEFYVVFFVDG
jgi:hypothetical protein